jgi:transcriptional regulator with GAF, ATPase, and Fis domain
MAEPSTTSTFDEALHAAEVESIERRIMDLALERTGATNGALFLWDSAEDALAIDFHVVDGVVIQLPGALVRRREDGSPSGIAMWVHDDNRPYLCNDTGRDPHYAPYFLDVKSVAAAPIDYQGRAIGVLSVSATTVDAFTEQALAELATLATSSAKFLRRAQLARAKGVGRSRPFVIKGLCEQWLAVERQLERVAATNAPVLIQGESGTGKELVANAIHFNSPRADAPFVTVNCAAIPDTLLESTLFGHLRGAFTGASFAKVGEFRKADGGVLFLDEVGELPLSLQAKLLRAVEDGEFLPLGSNDAPERVDVRLVCATRRELAHMVREGGFRDDLYFRLSVVTLELPPLRQYKQNLQVLAQIFAQQAAAKHGRAVSRISPEAMAELSAYDYPGNVRELKNALERAVIMASSEVIQAEDLPRSLRTAAGGQLDAVPPSPRRQPLREAREAWLAPMETQYLVDLLHECDDNVRLAAERAGVNVVTLYRLLHKRGLRRRRAFERA